MRRARAAVAVLVAGTAIVASCAKNPTVTLVLLDPCAASGTSFKHDANYTEVAVFKGGCPTDAELASGDTSKAVFSGVAGKDQPLPAVGDLSKAKYGFAAVLRDANCGVIGFGCTEADLNSIREVRIAVRAWTQPDRRNLCKPLTGPGCKAPLACEDGRCVSSGDGSTGSCDLSLVASGGLPVVGGGSGDSGSGPQISGPTVAASSTGFVIGYRTQVGDQMIANAALLTTSGTIASPSSLNLAVCPTHAPIDGVGLAFSGNTGLMALGLPDCDTKGAGAYFMLVDEQGKLSALKMVRSPGSFKSLTLARTHSLSGTGTSGAYNFVYRAVPLLAPKIQLTSLQGTSFAGTPKALFSDKTSDFGMVASTAQVLALLGRVPSKGAVELDVSPATGNGGPPSAFLLPDSHWGAITAWDDRAAAIAPGSGAGLTLQAATASGDDLGQITLPGGVFLSGDLVALGDHLIVVGSSAQALTVYRIDGAQSPAPPVPDAGQPPFDASSSDATSDASLSDASSSDASSSDASSSDASSSDASSSDASSSDASSSDASSSDTGSPPPPDAGQSNSLSIGTQVSLDISKLSLPAAGRTFDGRQVSIAVLGNEVAVVWASTLKPDPAVPGGWALLKCVQ